jgi:hypothetical protein
VLGLLKPLDGEGDIGRRLVWCATLTIGSTNGQRAGRQCPITNGLNIERDNCLSVDFSRGSVGLRSRSLGRASDPLGGPEASGRSVWLKGPEGCAVPLTSGSTRASLTSLRRRNSLNIFALDKLIRQNRRSARKDGHASEDYRECRTTATSSEEFCTAELKPRTGSGDPSPHEAG